MKSPIAVPSLIAFACLASASVVLAATADHQQCYKIKDNAAAVAYLADLVPTDGAFPVATGCKLKSRAKLLCIDVDKTNVTPTPPGAAPGLQAQKSLCYKVKCPAPASPISVTAIDQFGSHGLLASNSSLLCVPIPAPGGCATAGDCSSVPNATVACMASSCVISSCDPGYTDCDATFATGCEVYTAADTSNCGGCGTVCPFVPNATSACTSGSCSIGSCSPDYADCNVNPVDGCEVYTATDPSNCGGCGLVCPFGMPNCTSGSCVP